MNYNKGIEEGKKSQSPLWILSGFISIIGVFLVLFKNKNPKTDGLGDEYIKGYKKGVTKRRWLFFIVGFVLYMSIFTVMDMVSNDENSNSETTTETEKKKRNTITGKYYQTYDKSEWVTEIKENESYVTKLYKNGEEKYSKKGKWNILIINDQFNSVKKSNESSTEYKIIVFDNSTYLVVDDENCLIGVSKKVQDLMIDLKYNFTPSIPGLLSSLDIDSPISLSTYQTLCYDEELTNKK